MDLRKPCVKSMTQRGNGLQSVYIWSTCIVLKLA